MVKNILLKCDEKFFWKLRDHKFKLEKEQGAPMNWEEYIELLFGLKTK